MAQARPQGHIEWLWKWATSATNTNTHQLATKAPLNLSSDHRLNFARAPPWAPENGTQELISILVLCIAVLLFFCFRIPQKICWFFRAGNFRQSGNC
ncbi:protein O8 [Cercopithecine betaherpesvirus 5]|uniref:Protein O8 n=1 Tax=Simian cytomegalovirus (strain Colburn) TaxID=50292 RepID=G8XTS2_SCMVC|nr:protein O8 [Cercopithecine betaherpesvirus 5]